MDGWKPQELKAFLTRYPWALNISNRYKPTPLLFFYQSHSP